MDPALKTELLTCDTPATFAAAVSRAAAVLRGGGLVALPTETVYGLAANALDPRAVARIFEVKGRPPHNPIIVHVASLELARHCVASWPADADRMARAFWPGPLTLVLPKSPAIPAIVTAGGSTVGIRWPAHPVMQAVIRTLGLPLAAPSANLSARTSPTSAAHVQRALGGRIPLILDGGPCQVGLESTVLDLSVDPPRILRPGMIHEPALTAVLGRVETGAGRGPGTLRSPGLLERHYAPRARLVVLQWRDTRDLLRQLDRLEPRPEGRPAPAAGVRTCVIAHSVIPAGARWHRVSVIPHDPQAYARALYAELHRCDEEGAEWVVVEQPPSGPEWRAVADRLRRAAAR